MNHALDEVLERYLFKQLPHDEASDLEDHLLLCDSCRQRLQDTEEFVAATRIAARRLESKPGFTFAGLFGSLHPAKSAYAVLAMAVLVMAWGVPKLARPAAEWQDAEMRVMRGAEGSLATTVSSGRQIRLRVDLSELPVQPAWRVDVADASGSIVYSTKVQASAASLTVPVERRLRPGQYWVRLYGPPDAADPLREFGLEVGK